MKESTKEKLANEVIEFLESKTAILKEHKDQDIRKILGYAYKLMTRNMKLDKAIAKDKTEDVKEEEPQEDTEEAE